MSTKKKLLEAAAGVASGDPVYVEDVFSTYLYEGTNSTQGIPNGINLGDFGVGTSTRFNGTSDFLSRSSDLTSNSDSKTFTFSCWVFTPARDSRNNDNQRVLYATDSSDNGILINIDATNTLGLESWSGGSRTFQANSTTKIPVNAWTHILVSIDTANSSNRHVYINDVADSSTWYSYNNQNVEFTRPTHYIGVWGNGTSRHYYDSMAHMYLDYTYRDLSTESNRRIFIDANGGSTSASSLAALNPIMYLPMTTAYAVGKNAGTGGDFTASGSPTIVENGTEYVTDSGQGGLIWLKNRSLTVSHRLVDTERGVSNRLESDTANAEYFQSGQFVTGFNSNGFTLDGTEAGANDGYTPSDYASWTFRKQEKFFDIVKYTGTGSARDIAHNLGSVPGMVIIKSLDRTYKWIVSHRSFANLSEYISLNETSAKSTDANVFGSSSDSHTATTFHVGTDSYGNQSGDEYVAYLFAHNDGDGEFGEDGDQDIIKCGSYTGNGSGVGPSINLGFEPQWLMIKSTGSNSGVWTMIDTMRGAFVGGSDEWMAANDSALEQSFEFLSVTPTGFNINTSGYYVNASSVEYIYVAIRRPHKPASEFAATDLFNVSTGNNTDPAFNSGFVTDFNFYRDVTGGSDFYTSSRLTGNKYLATNSNAVESTSSSFTWDFMNGFRDGTLNTDFYSWMWRRAPGFFDVVAYAGDGTSSRAITHNLGVVPEMIWLKNRDRSGGGANWVAAFSSTAPDEGALNTGGGFAAYGNITAFSASTFTLLNGAEEINHGSYDYIAYLFATVAGISKVGSYTGTGNDLNVDCGFSAGARFVLIKRTDAVGDWYVWDSVRGIVAGNDPYLLLNDTAAQVTNTDYIDPLSSGFTVTSSAPAALNNSGGTYLFLAIA